MANKCTKCYSVLNKCQACNGKGARQMSTCNKCRNTGVVCVQHGGFWKN